MLLGQITLMKTGPQSEIKYARKGVKFIWWVWWWTRFSWIKIWANANTLGGILFSVAWIYKFQLYGSIDGFTGLPTEKSLMLQITGSRLMYNGKTPLDYLIIIILWWGCSVVFSLEDYSLGTLSVKQTGE